MNFAHRWLCKSGMWQQVVQTHVIPWALEDLELGTKVLEIGSGPGITTECLRALVPDLSCIEIDASYASSLARRMGSNRLRVICADGAAMPLADAKFDAVVCFTMLHHMPSTALQDRLLKEIVRVLRQGGILAGVDSLSNPLFRLFHLFDTMVPVDPRSFAERLRRAGFQDAQVDLGRRDFRFRARKPG